MTTPPCAGNVDWFVLTKSAELSYSQFKAIEAVQGDDFRPTQPLDGRVTSVTTRRWGH